MQWRYLQLDFSAQENIGDERLAIRLKRELSQRLGRLDVAEAYKKRTGRQRRRFMRVERGRSGCGLGEFAVAR
jgi:hypothetical protein